MASRRLLCIGLMEKGELFVYQMFSVSGQRNPGGQNNVHPSFGEDVRLSHGASVS